MKSLIEIYNPSEKVQEDTFKKFIDGEIEKGKELVRYHGVRDLIITTGGTIACVLVAGIVADNKTKPINFWKKR